MGCLWNAWRQVLQEAAGHQRGTLGNLGAYALAPLPPPPPPLLARRRPTSTTNLCLALSAPPPPLLLLLLAPLCCCLGPGPSAVAAGSPAGLGACQWTSTSGSRSHTCTVPPQTSNSRCSQYMHVLALVQILQAAKGVQQQLGHGHGMEQ